MRAESAAAWPRETGSWWAVRAQGSWTRSSHHPAPGPADAPHASSRALQRSRLSLWPLPSEAPNSLEELSAVASQGRAVISENSPVVLHLHVMKNVLLSKLYKSRLRALAADMSVFQDC